ALPMIRSMTAFASGERQGPAGTLACELCAVNHRFLEVGLRVPEELRALEPAMRERVATRIHRGKLDLGFRLRTDGAGTLELDGAAVAALARVGMDMQAKFP